MHNFLEPTQYIGRNFFEVSKILGSWNIDSRVVMEDGKPHVVTMDVKIDRLNFHLENNIIVKATIG
jgi:hypothetical protein